jgi:hypothetical protein
MSIQQDTNNVEQALYNCLMSSLQCANMNKPSGKADISKRHGHCLKATTALKDTKVSGVKDNAMTLLKNFGLENGLDSHGVDGNNLNVFAKTVNGSGLNAKNQAYYICQAVQNVFEHYLKEAGIDLLKVTNDALLAASASIAQDMVPIIEEEAAPTFNLAGSTSDNDLSDLIEEEDDDDDDDDNTVASIEGSFLTMEKIKEYIRDPSVLQVAFDLHTSDANSAGNGKFYRFYNGSSKEQGCASLKQFDSVLNGHAASLCQIAWRRLTVSGNPKFAYAPTLVNNEGKSRPFETIARKAAAAIMVLSGATKFNHNLCKYISDETSETLRVQLFGGVPESDQPLKSTYGFSYPYQRGNATTAVDTAAEEASIIDLL